MIVISQPCSLGLEAEEEVDFDQKVEQTLELLVNKRYSTSLKESSDTMASEDVIELGGFLTVSF